MNGPRSKTPASPTPQIQGQHQPRNSFAIGGEDNNYQFSLQQNQQFNIPYEVNKSFGAPRMPSPGLSQQPTTTLYQPQQGMRQSNAPYFQGAQPGVRQRFPTNMQSPQNQAGWSPMMFVPYGQHGNQHQIIVNSMIPPQRMPAQSFTPSSNIQTSQQQGMYPVPQQNIPYTPGYHNTTVYYGQNTSQNRPPSASGQPNTARKKESKAIEIKDPNTGKVVVLGGHPEEPPPRSTPTSIATTEQAPATSARAQNEIAAIFAEKVAKAIYEHPTDVPGDNKQFQSPPHSTPSPQQQQQLQYPPQQMQQIPQATGAHQNVQPGPPHQNVPPGPPHQNLPPGPPHQSAPPGPPHQNVPPGPPHQNVPPGPPHQNVPPGPPHQNVPPGPPHQNVQPGPPHQTGPPGPPHQNVPPGPPHQNVPPGPPHQNVPPGPPHQNVPTGPPHQNVPPGPVIMSSSMPNDIHGNHRMMEGVGMPPQHPPHMIQQSVPAVAPVPVTVPVNTSRLQGQVDVPEMPQNSNSMHGVTNHSLPTSESVEPANSKVATVPAQSQSLSNGTTLAQQKPAQNGTLQQSASASDSVTPSDMNTQKPANAGREISPSKQTLSEKQVDPSQSLSHGEPVTVSVAKPASEQLSESSDKTPANTKQEPPEVHIMPPTPVAKESKVELETPVSNTESAQEFSVPKKEKAKKRAKELNKKGEKITGSEYDAYVDKKEEEAETSTNVSDKLSPTLAEAIQEPEPEVIPVAKEDSPVNEVDPEESKSVDEPAVVTSIPKTEIQIEDVDSSKPDEGAQDELMKVKGEEQEEEESEEAMLKYKYCEDQWSPLNPEGKKHYDREFLLQFQFESAATLKPEGLPDIPDIILDKPLNVGRSFSRDINVDRGSSHDSFVDFTPKYVWQSSGQGGGGRQSKGIPRPPSSQKNKGQGGPAPRQINVSISKDIELHRAKDAWKPTPKEKKELTEDDDLYKKTRSILNKLTPQKFQTLVSQMQALPIDSETKLKGVIDLVFEKAISEPNFSVAYANMCRCLSMFKVASENKPREMVNFRAVLLTRCQREFEKDKSSEALFKEKRELISKTEPGQKKDELTQELEYEESKAKRRSLGNIRFIGELFKLKMLTENIMHDCVFKLLRTKDPENLECLCRLLTTIGKELDVDKAKPRMDQYFQQMQKIVNEKKTSSRVRFMLQDVIDLRLNKWVPRRVDNNPKTIDQIHKEVEQEAQEKALLAQQAHIAQKSQPRGGQGGRRGPPGQMGGGSDGWNTVGGSRTPLKSVDRSIDPSKIKFSKQNVDESNIQLGPGGGAHRFAGWGRGSTGGTTGRPSQEKEKPNAPANRFSVLNKPDEDSSRRYGGTSPARGDSKGRGGFGRPPSLNPRQSQEMEREKALSAAKAIGRPSAEGTQRDRSRGRELDKPDIDLPVTVAPAVKELTADEMEKKTKSILDEFLHIQDLKEAILCVKELSANNHHHFVYNAINHVIERSTVARRQTGHLLHDLVKENVITSESYLKGLLEVLEFAEDMEIDIPKIWQYYGELISPMIQDGSVPLSFLKQVCQPLLSSNKAGILLAEVLHDASHREGHKKVAGLWTASGLQWSDFVPKNQVEQFLKDKDLEFTKGGDSAPTTPTTGLPLQEIADKLHLLIVSQCADNEAVFDWIESNVDEPTTKQPKFIRALMTAVCNSAIKGEKGKERVEPKDINNRNDLLQKYLDHQAESELQALYALQALVTKLEHPPGVLRHMFDTLYDEDIISEDAFIQWEKSEDEPDGKGASLKQVLQFFTWLREAEDDS